KQITAYTLGFVQGPSAFIKFNHITAGIFTDARSALGEHSGDLISPIRFDSLAYNEIYHVPAFKTAMMNWSEIGFNLGAEFIQTDNSLMSGAINVKFLGGFDGMYFHNNESFDFEKIPHE